MLPTMTMLANVNHNVHVPATPCNSRIVSRSSTTASTETPCNSRILSIGGKAVSSTLGNDVAANNGKEIGRSNGNGNGMDRNQLSSSLGGEGEPKAIMSVGSGELIQSPVMSNGNEIEIHCIKTGIGTSNVVAREVGNGVLDSSHGHVINGNINFTRNAPEPPLTMSNTSHRPVVVLEEATGSESSSSGPEQPSFEQEQALREAVVNMSLKNGIHQKNSIVPSGIPPLQPRGTISTPALSSNKLPSMSLPPRPPVYTVTDKTIHRVDSTERYPTDETQSQSTRGEGTLPSHAATTSSTLDSYPTATVVPSSTLLATGAPILGTVAGEREDLPIGSAIARLTSSPLLTAEVVNETYTQQKISPLTTPPRSPQTMEPVVMMQQQPTGVGGAIGAVAVALLEDSGSHIPLMNGGGTMMDQHGGPTPTMSNVNSDHMLPIHPFSLASSMGHSEEDGHGSFDLPLIHMQPPPPVLPTQFQPIPVAPDSPYSATRSKQHCTQQVQVVNTTSSTSTPHNTTIFTQATNPATSTLPLHPQMPPQPLPTQPQQPSPPQPTQPQQQQNFSHKTSPMSQSSLSNIPPQPLQLPPQPQLQPSHTSTHINNFTINPSPSPTNFDSLLQSPDAEAPKDEIVEKSPGERYVRFSEKLGSGAYKVVYRAYDTIEGIEVAWNVVNLSGVPKAERQYVVNEVRLLEKLNHANIISFHGSWVNREREQVIFVTEILSSGTLKSFITKVQVIRNKIAKRWAVQILKGLEYLHTHDPLIIHRDLKCDNIFINGTSGDLRIGDLGLSTVLMSSNKSKVSFLLDSCPFLVYELITFLKSNKKVLSVLGTPEFMAPELYDESYDQKVDIYAFGMCMLEIFTKEVPYGECSNPAQIYKKVTKGIEPESLSRIRNDKARDFIRQCLGEPAGGEHNGFIRPSASELLRHPFLASGADDDLEIEVDPPVRERAISEVGTTMSDVTLTVNPSGTSNIGPGTSSAVSKTLESQVTNSSLLPPNSVQFQPSHRDTANCSFEAANKEKRHSIDSTYDGPPSQFTEGREGALHSSSEQEIGNDQYANDVHIPEEFQSLLEQEYNSRRVKVSSASPSRHRLLSHSNINSQQPLISNTDKDEPFSKLNLIHTGETSTASNSEMTVTNILAPFKDNQVENEIVLKIPLKLNEKEQHVQFDFHLIEDDPVQVAKEMVRELAFPEDAVLGISERISALARKARMENKGYNKPEESTNKVRQLKSTILRAELPPQAPNVNLQPSQNDSALNTSDPVATNRTIAPQKHLNIKEPAKVTTKTTTTTTATPVNLVDTDGSHFQPVSTSDDKVTKIESDVNEVRLKQARVDHENKVKRTKKAFQTRIDNIQRSKEEKEAQYLKMIEKYEKEKAATEKRILQTEKEQQDRLQKLEDEWELEKIKMVETSINAENDRPPLIPIPGTDEKLNPTTRTAAEQNEHASTVSLLSMTSANGGEKKGLTSEPLSSSSPTISLEGSC